MLHQHIRIERKNLFVRLLMRMMRSQVNCWIAVSKEAAQSLIAYGGIPPDKVVVISNCIPVKKFAQSGQQSLDSIPPAIRTLSEDVLRIAFIGRLEFQKGCDLLLSALSKVSVPFHLFVFGTGSLRSALEQQAYTMKIANNVTFLGHQQQVWASASACDLLAVPSRWEGSPRVVLEAQAVGLPVVAFSLPGVQEMLPDGKAGILIPINDTDAFAGAIETLHKDPELRAALTRGAHENIREHDFHKFLEAVEQQYDLLLKQ